MSSPDGTESRPRWQAVSAIDRRVLGVLVEKAKTTPEVYPLSLNGVCTGCNQKNNRAPVMQLEPEQVADSLERLRHLGAVGLVEGSGRVDKFRHYLYDWLGVDKVELAVMAELLLRGDQTEGELRGRASRMEPIADLAALRTVLDALGAKELVISLTPDGRGHVVSHALYMPPELERLRARYAAQTGHEPPADDAEDEPRAAAPSHSRSAPASQEMEQLRTQVSLLREEVEGLTFALNQVKDDVERLKRDLGVG